MARRYVNEKQKSKIHDEQATSKIKEKRWERTVSHRIERDDDQALT